MIPVCRHLVRSMHVDKASGLISFTSRVPPKLLRGCLHCTQCGVCLLLGLALLQVAANGPDWELAVDPTAAGGKLAQERLCMDCMGEPWGQKF